MSTVQAHSVKDALQIWMQRYRPALGEQVSVKKRGAGDDWYDFTITR